MVDMISMDDNVAFGKIAFLPYFKGDKTKRIKVE